MHGRRAVTRWFAAHSHGAGTFCHLNITHSMPATILPATGSTHSTLYADEWSRRGGSRQIYSAGNRHYLRHVEWRLFGALGWYYAAAVTILIMSIYSLLALLLALGSVDASPAFRQITELGQNHKCAMADHGLPFIIKNQQKPFP